MLKVAIMLLSPPKYFISIEIEISAIVLLAATDNPREVKKSLNSSLCIFFSL